MKKILIASTLIVGLATGLAFAHGNGCGHRGSGYHMGGSGYTKMGPCMMNNYGGKGGWANKNCPGAAGANQGSWNSDTQQKFLEETIELRRELNNKRFEYREASRASGAKAEQLANMEKEIIDIRTKIHKKAEELSITTK